MRRAWEGSGWWWVVLVHVLLESIRAVGGTESILFSNLFYLASKTAGQNGYIYTMHASRIMCGLNTHTHTHMQIYYIQTHFTWELFYICMRVCVSQELCKVYLHPCGSLSDRIMWTIKTEFIFWESDQNYVFIRYYCPKMCTFYQPHTILACTHTQLLYVCMCLFKCIYMQDEQSNYLSTQKHWHRIKLLMCTFLAFSCA